MQAKLPYLQQRKAGYYYRQRIPLKLQSLFSRREIVSSLRTTCPKEAQSRAISMLASVTTLFEELQSTMNTMDYAAMETIADRWKKRVLNEDFENRLHGYFPKNKATPLKDRIAAKLRKMDFSKDSGWITQISRDNHLSPDPDSQDWKQLAYHLMNSQLGALSEIEKRDISGNQGMIYYSSEGDTNSPHEENPTISELLKQWESDRPRNPRSVIDWRVAIQRFIELNGDKTVQQITKADIRAYRDLCVELPAKLPKADRRLPAPALIKKYKHQQVDRLAARTANKYISSIKAVLGIGIREGYIDINPADGITVTMPKSSKKQRLPFEHQDLKAIFEQSPLYRINDRPSGGAGEAAYWIPLLALYTGARLEELGQLHLSDIREENGIFYLDLNEDDPGKTLKNAASIRRVPLHHHIIEAGFLQEVRRQKMKGEKHLFPLLQHHQSRCCSAFSKWVNRYISKTCGIDDSRKVFHCFRHTFKDACRRAEIQRDIHDALTGHSDGAVSSHYGSGFPIKILHDAINKISYEGLQLPKAPEVLKEFKPSGFDQGESFSRPFSYS